MVDNNGVGSTRTEQQGAGSVFFPSLNSSYLRSLFGTIALGELLCGLLAWSLVASTPYWLFAAYKWVMFVTVFCWVMTLLLVAYQSLALPVHCLSVPWPLFVLCLDALSAVMYLTAFITDAASVRLASGVPSVYNRWAASTFFALLCTLLYAAGSYLGWLEWKSGGESGATGSSSGGGGGHVTTAHGLEGGVPGPYQQ
ncbi:plasmolipin-like [Petromyzon marinus]|uniref:Plasmolipin n=1 Tax=Petromyzon marinus TaxID=7757 RepID=A0AAJ7UBQ6_PETMA|nr:plasmolipin-like [Petromyzon marinus]